MFTLKFSNSNKDGTFWNVLSACRYQISEKVASGTTKMIGAIVSVYPVYNHDDSGVDFQVGMDDRGYDTLFIENESGKTIDRIGPFDLSELVGTL